MKIYLVQMLILLPSCLDFILLSRMLKRPICWCSPFTDHIKECTNKQMITMETWHASLIIIHNNKTCLVLGLKDLAMQRNRQPNYCGPHILLPALYLLDSAFEAGHIVVVIH